MRSFGVSGGKYLATQMAVCSWIYFCKQSLILTEETSRLTASRKTSFGFKIAVLSL